MITQGRALRGTGLEAVDQLPEGREPLCGDVLRVRPAEVDVGRILETNGLRHTAERAFARRTGIVQGRHVVIQLGAQVPEPGSLVVPLLRRALDCPLQRSADLRDDVGLLGLVRMQLEAKLPEPHVRESVVDHVEGNTRFCFFTVLHADVPLFTANDDYGPADSRYAVGITAQAGWRFGS